MKIEAIQDLQRLPSVLDTAEVGRRLVELVAVLRRDRIPALTGAEAINDLISYRGHSLDHLDNEASRVVLAWIAEHYDTNDEELIDCQIANVANMAPGLAREFFEKRLAQGASDGISDFERTEIESALAELEELHGLRFP